MGKGDRKSRRGKIWRKSYGISRPRRSSGQPFIPKSARKVAEPVIAKAAVTPAVVEQAPVVTAAAVEETKTVTAAPAAKKAAVKKPAAKKTATPKKAAAPKKTAAKKTTAKKK